MKARLGSILFATTLAGAATLIGTGPATAAPAWAGDHFKVCWDTRCTVVAEGNITWGNRTSQVSVTISAPGYNASAYFDAFAGTTKVDSNVVFKPGGTFTLGDPNLPGGVNRIRTQVCVTGSEGQFGCGAQWNDIRD